MFAWIVTHPVAYPALEVVHIVGIALLLGNLVLLESRVWGLHAGLDIATLSRATTTLALAGFGLVLASGLLMFASNPEELIANRSFVIKMGLVAMAGINAAVFHARGGVGKPDHVARAQTALSVGLWITVIIAGRWIAYV